MKHLFTRILFFALLFSGSLYAQMSTPEVLYYRFDGSGTSVPNLASAPPAGTLTATIMGGVTQGSGGQCGGALIGSGVSSSTDYLNTGYAPSLTGSWTISMYTKDITASATLFYIFGDNTASSFRCFTNGVAGANNWILRGPITDVLVSGGATVAPHVTTFVYDQAAGNIKAYLDGVLVNTVAEASATIVGTGPFKVMGYSTNVGSPAGGKLDEFRMYSRALTAAEVMQLTAPYTSSTANVTACTSYISPAGYTRTSTGTYLDTIPNSTGCDSIITTNLTIIYPSSSSMSASACSSYTAPSGAMFTTSGTYMDTIPNVAGCDSVITINLSILNPTSSSISPVVCSSYLSPAGNTYTTSGTYTDIIPNSVGCDSTITINLTVNQPTSSSMNASACDMFTAPSGAMYMSSGMYMDTIPNVAGCDSVITINLTITNSSSSSISPVVCDSYNSPAGNTYTTSGTYTDVIPNMAGCDSTITINLTVNMSTASSITVSACDSYMSPAGNTYTSSGTYTDIIPNIAGCDSTITINLTVNTVNTSVTQSTFTLTAAASGATYQWINCSNMQPIAGATNQSYTATANGDYAVIVTENSCTDTSACVNITGIGITENEFANSISVYPNPSQGEFNIDLGKNYDAVSVTITDIAGRIVFEQKAENTTIIPVGLNAPAGVYIVTITAGEQKAMMRVTKE
jgi:hypothetical protein